MIFLNAEIAKELVRKNLLALGQNEEGAKHVSESLTLTSLRGVDSHGLNLFPHYVRALKAKRIEANPNFKIDKTAASVIKFDADHAFGHYAGAVAMNEAIKLAKETGVGLVSVKNSTHFGAAAYFGLIAAQQDFIGLAFTNADALVKAHGARDSFFGTNPICFTAPLKNEDPFCLDMATSRISWNKVMLYQKSGKALEEGWAFDAQGNPETDPNKAASLCPIGDYKGYGLGFLVEIVCGVLAGGPVARELLPMYKSAIEERRKISHFFAAINIESFIKLDVFKERLQEMVDQLRQMPPISADAPVMVAGDPEKKNLAQRSKEGIPMSEEIFAEFLKIDENFNKAKI
ncbi:MAG: Ldh family oxidoreductase [Candidatus Rifleibacteriota bacterium]